MVNKVILIGNLGKDPEHRRLDNGSTVATFSMATNESYKDKSGEWQQRSEWHNIVVWNKMADAAEKYYKKGMQLYVEGKLTTRSYTAKDGSTRYTTEVVARMARRTGKIERTNTQQAVPPPAEPTSTGGMDDLPF